MQSKHRFTGSWAKGVTLIELIIVISIIGILASFAAPSYINYLNRAKAAEVLVNIHQITLAYMDAAYSEAFQDLNAYDSPQLGTPPPAFSEQSGLYKTEHGFTLGSYVMGGNSLYSTQSVPVILVKAPSENLAILSALDSILQHQHTFLTPDIIAIRLTSLTDASSSAPAVNTPKPIATPTITPNLAPYQVPSATPSAIPSLVPTINEGGTGTGTGTGTGQSSSTVSDNTASSSPRPECYRHPGWIKNHLHGC